jgi:hypothetical protein
MPQFRANSTCLCSGHARWPGRTAINNTYWRGQACMASQTESVEPETGLSLPLTRSDWRTAANVLVRFQQGFEHYFERGRDLYRSIKPKTFPNSIPRDQPGRTGGAVPAREAGCGRFKHFRGAFACILYSTCGRFRRRFQKPTTVSALSASRGRNQCLFAVLLRL